MTTKIDALTQALRKLNAFVSSETPAASRNTLILFVVALVSSSAVMLWTGPYVQNLYGHDIPVYYSTAWKMLWGYKPHIDFNCTHGIVNFAFLVLGMKLTGVNAYSIVTANTLFFLVVSALAWGTCRLRFPPVICLIYTLFAGWVIMCAHALCFGYLTTSYAGLYNRQGYALLLILMPQAFLPRQRAFENRAFLDGGICGVILVLLLFLKITYFFAGAGFVTVGLIALHFSWRMIKGMILGSLIAGLPILIYFNFNLLPYYQDLALAASVRAALKPEVGYAGEPVISMHAALSTAVSMAPVILCLFLCLLLALQRGRSERGSIMQQWWSVIYVGSTVVISICILLTNFTGQKLDVPLLSALGLVLFEGANRVLPFETTSFIWHRAAICLIALGLIVPFSASALGSVGYAGYFKLVKAGQLRPQEKFQTPRLADLFIRGFGGDPPMPMTYAEKIEAGLQLLDEHVSPHATVEALDFVNLFPFASGRPPAKGALSWQYYISFTREHTLPVKRAFGDPDALMIPRYPSDREATAALLEIYGDYIRAEFEFRAESKSWVLLTRRTK